MKKKDLEKLMDVCVKMAKKSWHDNFSSQYTSGDQNRRVIGEMANTILKESFKDATLRESLLHDE